MAKKIKATLTHKRALTFDGKKWLYESWTREVRVMATAEGYAMVRLKGCMPFVASEKELTYTDGKK